MEKTNEAMENLRSDLESLKYNIEEEIDEEVQSEKVRGFTCTTENVAFQVLTIVDEEVEFFEVRYDFDAQETIARELKRRSEDRSMQEEVSIDSQEDAEFIDEARKKLIGLRESEFKKIHNGLAERLASTDTYTEIVPIENYGIQGFQLSVKIFPNKDFYNLSNLENAIMAVVNEGTLGAMFLAHSYELESFLESKFDTEEEEDSKDIGYIN